MGSSIQVSQLAIEAGVELAAKLCVGRLRGEAAWPGC
jgi:hypothetical protein